ncbi:putative yippee-like protein Os10g0369500 [Ananas comosus]|uniref:Protein yippee-like n=1 Tax=Ananas comosus TaxID=4615 RepID=A0A6P5FTS8_ANACO|nr:putative yippee-like protein Os10g0369500 [Ananas comosus]
MGLLFVESLPDQELFRCGLCEVVIASADAIMSTNFTGRFGAACLMDRVVNTTSSQTETKQMLTGTYDVSDIHCSSCQQLLGWRYDRAFSEDQKFKEGKYVLELSRVVKHGW